MDERSLLFIDWDGTLSNGRFWERLGQTQPEQYERIQKCLFVENSALVDAWMRGELNSEHICERLSDQTGINHKLIWTELVSSCETMEFEYAFRDAIRSLQQRFRCILATDNMDCFSRFTVQALKLNELFDDILISSDLRRLKNDENGKMFLTYVKSAESNFSRATCIDDSSATCRLFESLGGRAIITTHPTDTIQHLLHL